MASKPKTTESHPYRYMQQYGQPEMCKTLGEAKRRANTSLEFWKTRADRVAKDSIKSIMDLISEVDGITEDHLPAHVRGVIDVHADTKFDVRIWKEGT